MRLVNKTKYSFSHVVVVDGKTETYILPAGNEAEVPKEVADIWLKIEGVTETLSPEEIAKAKEEAVAAEKAKIVEEVKAEYEAKIAELEAKLKKKAK